MKTSEIRKSFIEYFLSKNHTNIPSSPLIPANDPTLLFTNAGMVQFKETFLGLEPRSYTRAVSSQCCLRAGGKHNDLDNVGYTARHHTYFEMLGNFSFGDYFKREAISFAWEFLTKVLKLPEEKLWVTVYEDDKEAEDIWLEEMRISSERFSRCGAKDNFWSMGDTGPCGPCTEIFYDHGAEVAGGPPGSPDEDGDRYVEIWNLVFMQFNRSADGSMQALPKPSVDTGMGLERIAAVLQGVHSNYDIDLFQHLIDAIVTIHPAVDRQASSVKVIADHIRACSFLICDAITPGNEGRGYVLRRIIRRAVRHGHKLGIASPFFHKLVPALAEIMGDAYPQLREKASYIAKVLQQEEDQFSKTLEQGLAVLKNGISDLKDATQIPGELAFKLYDTYGFPLDLTEDIAREQGLLVDREVFDACMQKQRQLSQTASHFQVDYNALPVFSSKTDFLGYDDSQSNTMVQHIVKDSQVVSSLCEGEEGILVLASTPFYAESGGQVGDTGTIFGENTRFLVKDTKKSGHAVLHIGVAEKGDFSVGQNVQAHIEAPRREAIRLNHTATHLLHAALKELVGEHIEQKGSLVNDGRSRFDFSHFEGLSESRLDAIEARVNSVIRKNYPVVTELMDIEMAKKSGAVALFGEKYGEKVRVLSIDAFSKELCGGTHVQRTGDIGIFKIISEFGVASGVRRIEFVTGDYAMQYLQAQFRMLSRSAQLLRTSAEHIEEKIAQCLTDQKSIEKELQKAKQTLAAESGKELKENYTQIGAIKLYCHQLEHADGNSLRQTLDQLKSTTQDAVIVLYTTQADKVQVIAGVSKPLIGKVPPAKEYVKQLCGKGGGREDMAQGGGPMPADFDARLAGLQDMLKNNDAEL